MLLAKSSGQKEHMLLDAFKTYRLVKSALASSYWPHEKIRRKQEEKLGKLLIHAYTNVRLYRKLYDQAGFRPEDFRSLDDLKKIPVLRKRELKEARPEEIVAHGVELSRCETVKTSGSSGTPLRIYLGPYEERWQRAVAWRILFEHGFRWTDRTLEIRMTFGKQFFIQSLGIAPKDWLSILELPELWVKFFSEKNHEVIVASASTLHAMAEAVETLSVKTVPPRIIVSDSETLSPAARHLIRRALGRDPIDVFGLVEVSNFAWQCEERMGFHISSDSHIVEVDASSGQPGPLIASDLGMWTMPIIRYDTGDLAEFDPRPCSCGRTLPLLRSIHGRAVDSVVLPDGSRLLWPFFHEVLGGYDELSQWRVIQDDRGHLRVQLVLSRNNANLVERIKASLCSVLPKEIGLSMEQVDTIPVMPGEKIRMIISNINTSTKNQS